MRHLKVFENAGQTVWVLSLDDIFEDKGQFSSYVKVFNTKQDAENYVINYAYEVQSDILSNDDPPGSWEAYTDKQKK